MTHALVGESQLKFLNPDRLRFAANVQTIAFDVGGLTAVSLLANVRQWHVRFINFVVVPVLGDDLRNRQDPGDIFPFCYEGI